MPALRLKPIRTLMLLALVTSMGACAAPPQPAPADQQEAANPPSQTAPAPFASELAAHAALRTTCERDSDCAVKDVGNCCGSYPACVNADSPVDPAAVARECADKGLAGICGFPVIEACVCSAGQCTAAPGEPDGAIR